MATNTRSILRYPGSKARFVDFISKSISLNGLRGCTFVEPFCGGASTSIALLEKGIVSKIAINDADPLIANLWDVVFSPTSAQKFAQEVLKVPLTIDEWKRQKALIPRTPFESAMKCLYLNRTSFNGIIHKSGPIGGWKQENRTLDVRFNRNKLANRILELSALSDRVICVYNKSWKDFCDDLGKLPNSFFYFDPPYYHKAEKLYGYYFDDSEHSYLRDYLIQSKLPWLLSYDYSSEVIDLYKLIQPKGRIIDSTYSTHPIGGASHIGREIMYTNLGRLPSAACDDAEHVGLTIRELNYSRNKSAELTRIPILLEQTQSNMAA